MQEFNLEKTYFQFMSLPDTDKPYALEYMRLALDASRHNLEMAYFNQQEAARANHDAPTGWDEVQGGII